MSVFAPQNASLYCDSRWYIKTNLVSIMVKSWPKIVWSRNRSFATCFGRVYICWHVAISVARVHSITHLRTHLHTYARTHARTNTNTPFPCTFSDSINGLPITVPLKPFVPYTNLFSVLKDGKPFLWSFIFLLSLYPHFSSSRRVFVPLWKAAI